MKCLYLIPIGMMTLCSGCKVGPDYQGVDSVVPVSFTEVKTSETFEIDDESLVHWWVNTFDDSFLNELMEESISSNFDYRIALEQVLQARSQYWIQFTQLLPEIDGNATASRFRVSQAFASAASPVTSATTPTTATRAASSLSPIQNFFQFGFDAIWEIDIFGGLRRAADSALDLWEASYDYSRAVKIIVLSEVANTYVSICANQQKVNIAMQVVQLDEELLQLSSFRFQAGLANEQEVDSAVATLEADKANLKTLQILLKQTIYSLATLLGRLPEDIIANFQIDRAIPISRGKIPAGLPSDLLRRRYDILTAERQLASSTELIGVAVADLFPKISLTGSSGSFASNPLQGANIGWSSDKFSKLFSPASRIWGIGTFITWPMFDFGKRWAAIDMQESIMRQSYLNYQKTVIAAFQESEQAFVAYFNEEERLHDLSRQEQVNRRNLELTTDLFESGLDSYTEVLQAKEIWLASVSLLIDSEQNLSTDLIAVYKALGGDW